VNLEITAERLNQLGQQGLGKQLQIWLEYKPKIKASSPSSEHIFIDYLQKRKKTPTLFKRCLDGNADQRSINFK
jgi:hypothetical protein